MQLRRPAGGDDAGFTLVELLVVIVILAVITVPLANAVIGYARNSDATSQRLALSHDAQITAAFFARDVATVGVRDYSQSGAPISQAVQTNAAYNAGGLTCGTSATPTALLRLLSDDWTTGGNPTVSTDVVAYYLETTGTVRALHRLRCAGGSTSDSIVAHYVDPTTLTLTCDGAACPASSVPQQVTMAFTVTQPKADPYPISVTGQRRQT